MSPPITAAGRCRTQASEGSVSSLQPWATPFRRASSPGCAVAGAPCLALGARTIDTQTVRTASVRSRTRCAPAGQT